MIDYDKVLEDVFDKKIEWMVRLARHYIRDRMARAEISIEVQKYITTDNLQYLHDQAQRRLSSFK